MHEGGVGVFGGEVFEGEGGHGGAVGGAGADAVVVGVFEVEVGFVEGGFGRGGEDGEDVRRLLREEVGDEAEAGVVSEGEEGVEAFFGFWLWIGRKWSAGL